MPESEKTVEQLLVEVVESQKEANKWLRFLAWPTLRTMLDEALKTPEDRRIYQASDGRQIREVLVTAGVSFGKVQSSWQRWAKAGLMQEGGRSGRYQRLVDLSNIGIEVEEASGRKPRNSKRDQDDETGDSGHTINPGAIS